MPRLGQTVILVGIWLAMGTGSVLAQSADGEQLLKSQCGTCHMPSPSGGLSRIAEQRKTPEGWDMSIVRMMQLHGVNIDPDSRSALVRHLADTQGLAPAEAQDWRYILEREPAVVETPPDDQMAQMCARCHSYARVALQRRSEDEWRKLMHFHLGQYPTTEYQALGRDRNWWEIASTEMPGRLVELFPLDSEAWNTWKQQEKPDPAGSWRVAGYRPGMGRYEGALSVTAADQGYDTELTLRYADGSGVSGSGRALVYTGYEWRGRLDLGDEDIMQIFALSEDGQSLDGRWFPADNDAVSADFQAIRNSGDSQLLAVEPPYLRAGQGGEIALHGVALDGEVSLGEGVEVVEVLSQSADTLVVQARASADAASGSRSVQVGGAAAENLFTIYQQVDAVRVEPEFNIARVGDAGGPIPGVPAQFSAVAYANGPDGEAGSDDDIRIGVMPASWSVANASPAAEAMEDTRYAGEMQANGLFLPADAGLNPERKYSTNNAGELTVQATVEDGEHSVEGSGRLVVTVQRWNDPPIR